MRINLFSMVLALTGALAFSPAALAQDSKSEPELPDGQGGAFGPRAGAKAQPQQAAPAPKTVATHGAWTVQCSELPAEQGGKSCGMVQAAKSEKDERVAISVIVSRVARDGKAVTLMRILAPIGVYIPTGIPVEIDGTALPKPISFNRCLPRICEGFGEASPETLTKFKKGGAATFYLYDRPGNGYPLKISLEGFGAALDELEKL